MASGLELMMKSMLGIDPDDIRQAVITMQDNFTALMRAYKTDSDHTRECLTAIMTQQARIESKLDRLLLASGETVASIIEHDDTPQSNGVISHVQ